MTTLFLDVANPGPTSGPAGLIMLLAVIIVFAVTLLVAFVMVLRILKNRKSRRMALTPVTQSVGAPQAKP